MAYRDKSQGFAFVYVDVKKILKEARERAELAKEAQAEKPEPIEQHAPIETDGQVINFQKERRAKLPEGFKRLNPHTPLEPNPSQVVQSRRESVEHIKANLDRLQSLHHKLHTVLADIEKRTDKKKK